jgi:hypothetical protein
MEIKNCCEVYNVLTDGVHSRCNAANTTVDCSEWLTALFISQLICLDGGSVHCTSSALHPLKNGIRHSNILSVYFKSTLIITFELFNLYSDYMIIFNVEMVLTLF